MAAKERMTSVSVSYETRRMLNTMRTMEGYKSIDELLKHLTRNHALQRLHGAQQDLRKRIEALSELDIQALMERLNGG